MYIYPNVQFMFSILSGVTYLFPLQAPEFCLNLVKSAIGKPSTNKSIQNREFAPSERVACYAPAYIIAIVLLIIIFLENNVNCFFQILSTRLYICIFSCSHVSQLNYRCIWATQDHWTLENCIEITINCINKQGHDFPVSDFSVRLYKSWKDFWWTF